jgi:ABC-type antimicrobial peptide transport system permease subunit
VLAHEIGRGALLVVIGLVVGLGLSAAGVRLLQGMLFGVASFDPLTYAVVTLLMLAVAMLATWLPARRAAWVEPSEALRFE